MVIAKTSRQPGVNRMMRKGPESMGRKNKFFMPVFHMITY